MQPNILCVAQNFVHSNCR